MYYSIGEKLVRIKEEEISEPFVAVLTSDGFKKDALPPGFDRSVMQHYPQQRFCKAEVHKEMLSGTISVPEKKCFDKKMAFSYYINSSGVIFIDDSGLVAGLIEKTKNSVLWREPSVGHFFYTFLETLVENDLMHLEDIEDRLAKLETSVLSDKLDGFMRSIVSIRKEILSSSHYYSQLCDVALVFLENENEIFDGSALRLLKHFSDRVHRLRQETQMLREYSLQISEAYQTQIDIRQNIVMKVLTTVTAIFLPLSLIAGWYGMNFKHMPELCWRYGYHYVFLLSIIVVIGCVWIFKKKKFLG